MEIKLKQNKTCTIMWIILTNPGNLVWCRGRKKNGLVINMSHNQDPGAKLMRYSMESMDSNSYLCRSITGSTPALRDEICLMEWVKQQSFLLFTASPTTCNTTKSRRLRWKWHFTVLGALQTHSKKKVLLWECSRTDK